MKFGSLEFGNYFVGKKTRSLEVCKFETTVGRFGRLEVWKFGKIKV